jgi:hypothetical protein
MNLSPREQFLVGQDIIIPVPVYYFIFKIVSCAAIWVFTHARTAGKKRRK